MTLAPAAVVVLGGLLLAVIFFVLWLFEEKRRDAGIVDVGWAASLGLLAILYASFLDAPLARRLFVAALACAWSFRLAIYLGARIRGRPEDRRYAALRKDWGESASSKFFRFYEFQAATVVILSLPVLVAMLNPAPRPLLDALAAALLLVSVGGESVADVQLARFRRRPDSAKRTCREGLWRYSRHPNYFFEWLHWWVYVLLAVGSPWLWVTLIAPAMMLYVLLRLTGIPATEQQALASRGEDYREYQRTTSAFVPWFPRKGSP